jgi:hypothetical protein
MVDVDLEGRRRASPMRAIAIVPLGNEGTAEKGLLRLATARHTSYVAYPGAFSPHARGMIRSHGEQLSITGAL